MAEPRMRAMERRDIPAALDMSMENMSKIVLSSWSTPMREEDVLHLIEEPSSYSEVLEMDGRVVGYCCVHPVGQALYVDSIQVKKGCQGQGMGSAMMARIEEMAAARGMRSIGLYVQITNRNALAFYRHRGFRAVAKMGGNLLMEKMLGESW